MAIASDPEPTVSSVILGVVRAPAAELNEVEKEMRKREISILQKKTLEMNLDQVKEWFSEQPSEDPEVETVGYAIQAYDTPAVWSQLTQEIGPNMCGQAPMEILKDVFPSIVTENYLIQPAMAREYLSQMKSVIIAGMKEVCKEKPDNVVEHLANFLNQASKK